jgi:RNA polymerase sigma factor (sigma-70 family)
VDLHLESNELYHACRAEDEPARTEAYQRLGRLLYRVAWQRVAHDPPLHPLAEEAMQESLEQVWRHLDAGTGPAPESFIAWAITILINKVREGRRRLEPVGHSRPTRRVALSRQVSLDASTEPTGEALGDRLAAEAEAMDEGLAYQELQALVAEIRHLEALSLPSRTVLLRGYIEGLDDEELARLLRTSRANVHVIRSRDLAKLRNLPDFMARLERLQAPIAGGGEEVT